MIEAVSICKTFQQLQVLKDVSISIGKGEIVAVAGPSGAGKTTLLQILGTLDKADAGKVIINGTDVSGFSDHQLATFRNSQVGFVFQFHQLLPEFTAIENVCLPAWIKGKSREGSLGYARELLTILGISARADHKPRELSGGEAQRVAVARALINNPSIVFADEPSGNLDTENARELHELFFSLRDKFGQTFVLVTHNEELANRADRVIRMKDGRIISQ